MHIAILGTGDVGKALAAGLARHGHAVKIGTRDPTSGRLDAWLKEHPGVQMATFDDAAAGAKMVVLAVGWEAAQAVCAQVRGEVAGRVVVDVTNPLAHKPNGPPGLAVSGEDSAGEQVQRWMPEAHVVKCWNIVGNPHMIDPSFEGTPTMFIAGDDAEAKKTVRGLLEEVGWRDVIDLGPITSSRYLEAMAMAWILTYFATGSGDMSLALVRK